MEALEKISKELGLRFEDPALLRCALTLRSWVNEHPGTEWTSNQRLEFLGDAVLDLVIGEQLYRRFPDQDEGVLTPMRASLVSKKALSQVATQWGLGTHLFVGTGDEKSGARKRAATLSDALEAVVAALYLDAQNHGRNAISEIGALVVRLWGPSMDALDPEAQEDPRSELQKTVQAKLKATPRYYYEDKGPKRVECVIRVELEQGPRELGVASGPHRKLAGDRAAQDALAKRLW